MKKAVILFLCLSIIAMSCKHNNMDQMMPVPPPPADTTTVDTTVAEKTAFVSTFAGEGTKAFADGPLLSAKFAFPEDVVLADNGSMYVTDIVNFKIREILGGQVSTLAGTTFGILDGDHTVAQFKSPYSIAVDANGNVYSSDENDPRIRKTTPAGVVSVFAGKEQQGFADGPALQAQFLPGSHLLIDKQGNLIVADLENSRIRKINPAGIVSTIAGTDHPGFQDGTGANGWLAFPAGMTIDKDGNLFVVEVGNYDIRKITPAGVVTTVAGDGRLGFLDGDALHRAEFSDLRDIVIDSKGNLYVTDDNRIRKISINGIVSTIAGSDGGFAEGPGADAKFSFPNGLTIDAQDNIYVSDLNNNRIRKISFR